jgi:threonine/homoserine/homoserine lactone efflux protein
MEYALPLATIWLANLLASMSPGPSFVLVARASVGQSRRAGVASALGMAVGAVVWAAAAIFGLALLLAELAWLYRAIQVLGGLYLVYFGVAIWRGAASPLPVEGAAVAHGPWRAFVVALMIQLSNPKVVVFFGSIFIALLPAHAPAWVWIATLALVLLNETVWYSIVAFVFSAPPARRVYGGLKIWLDRAMAGFLAAIGVKLLFDSRS